MIGEVHVVVFPDRDNVDRGDRESVADHRVVFVGESQADMTSPHDDCPTVPIVGLGGVLGNVILDE